MARGKTMQLTEAEWKVMTAVWEGHPATARLVLERLEPGTGWAYTTVKTMLARLARKGTLRAVREGKAVAYRPTLTREEARRSALRALAERAFDGALAPMLHFLAKSERLGAKERAELIRMLEKGGGKP
jgi:predicted transcriptional regulator